MDVLQYFEVAIRALLANKLRSALTMLGVIIGVAAVVSLVSIGEGASEAITSQIEGAGANTIVVLPSTNLQATGMTTSDSLSLQDSAAIEAEVANVAAVSPEYRNTARVTFEGESQNILVFGTTPEQAFVRSVEMTLGRFLSEEDEEESARVAVLGSTTADTLFGGLDPIGRNIRINGVRFEVIGVAAPMGAGNPLTDPNERVYVPLSTAYRKLFGSGLGTSSDDPLSAITLSATSSEMIEQVMIDIEQLLQERHRLDEDDPLDFSVVSQEDLLDVVNEVTTILTVFLAAIASVSLLVGGIGIMNITLVSVTERTREIGLRKAVGAKHRHILVQFLIETVVLSTTGGVLGIILSSVLVLVVNQTGLLTSTLSVQAVLLGVSFSILVGLFFGIYPANRAAQLHPIEALRYE